MLTSCYSEYLPDRTSVKHMSSGCDQVDTSEWSVVRLALRGSLERSLAAKAVPLLDGDLEGRPLAMLDRAEKL